MIKIKKKDIANLLFEARFYGFDDDEVFDAVNLLANVSVKTGKDIFFSPAEDVEELYRKREIWKKRNLRL